MSAKLANILSACAYFAITLQWMWVIVTIVVPYLALSSVLEVFMPQSTTSPPTSVEPQPLGMFEWIIIIASVMFALGVSLYALLAVPRAIGRQASRVTKRTANVAVAQSTKHKPVSKQRKRRLTTEITWSIKLGLIVIPCLIAFMPPAHTLDLAHHLVITLTLILTVVAVVFFALQFLLVRITSIDKKALW